MKRLTAFLLALVMIVSIIPAAAADSTEPPVVFKDGNYVVTAEEYMSILQDVLEGKYPDFFNISLKVAVEDVGENGNESYSLFLVNDVTILVNFVHAGENEAYAAGDMDATPDQVLAMFGMQEINEDNFNVAMVVMLAMICLANRDMDNSGAYSMLSELISGMENTTGSLDDGERECIIATVSMDDTNVILFSVREFAVYNP